eukprot:185187-Pelagomonas_calceolata.AAC.2
MSRKAPVFHSHFKEPGQARCTVPNPRQHGWRSYLLVKVLIPIDLFLHSLIPVVGINGALSPGSGITPLFQSSLAGNKELVEMLLGRSTAALDAVDEYGYTPLMAAVESGCKDVVQILLDAGANVNKTNNVPCRSGCALIDKGILHGTQFECAFICTRTTSNLLACHYRQRFPSCARYQELSISVCPAASPTLTSASTKVIIILTCFVVGAVNLQEGFSALDAANYHGKKGIAQMLLEKGAKGGGDIHLWRSVRSQFGRRSEKVTSKHIFSVICLAVCIPKCVAGGDQGSIDMVGKVVDQNCLNIHRNIPELDNFPILLDMLFPGFFLKFNHANHYYSIKYHVHQMLMKIDGPQITLLASDHLTMAHSSTSGPFFTPGFFGL